jgi:hypothetical protein
MRFVKIYSGTAAGAGTGAGNGNGNGDGSGDGSGLCLATMNFIARISEAFIALLLMELK